MCRFNLQFDLEGVSYNWDERVDVEAFKRFADSALADQQFPGVFDTLTWSSKRIVSGRCDDVDTLKTRPLTEEQKALKHWAETRRRGYGRQKRAAPQKFVKIRCRDDTQGCKDATVVVHVDTWMMPTGCAADDSCVDMQTCERWQILAYAFSLWCRIEEMTLTDAAGALQYAHEFGLGRSKLMRGVLDKLATGMSVTATSQHCNSAYRSVCA